MAICHVKYPSQKVLHLWLWSTNSRNLKKYRWDKPEQYLTLKDQTIKSRDLRRTMMTHSLKIAGNFNRFMVVVKKNGVLAKVWFYFKRIKIVFYNFIIKRPVRLLQDINNSCLIFFFTTTTIDIQPKIPATWQKYR